MKPYRRVIDTHCADCGLDTKVAAEDYMVKAEVWAHAWAGRLKPLRGQQILCVGCLEARLGRTLTKCDFTAVPVNDPCFFIRKSERLLDRLGRPCPDTTES